MNPCWSVEKSPATSAATPPLGSLKATLSLCLSRQAQSKPCRVVAIDVKRAYFYAPATMTIHMGIPKEGWEVGDEVNVALLNLFLCGTRDAAMKWTKTHNSLLTDSGFVVGKCSPCNFVQPAKRITVTVHGDDLTCTGTEMTCGDLQKWCASSVGEKMV